MLKNHIYKGCDITPRAEPARDSDYLQRENSLHLLITQAVATLHSVTTEKLHKQYVVQESMSIATSRKRLGTVAWWRLALTPQTIAGVTTHECGTVGRLLSDASTSEFVDVQAILLE